MSHIITMDLSSFLSWFAGRDPASSASSPEHPDGVIPMTAEFNPKIGPLERGDRYEDPLDDALRGHGYGETDGGGTMQSKEGEIEFIDIHLRLQSPESSLPFVIQFLESRGAPKGSKLRLRDGDVAREIPFGVREGFAIYLDYQTSDSNFVVSEIDQRLAEHGEIEAYWQGPTETALYIYGDSIATMKPLIADFMASYPLCKGARVVDTAS